LEKAWKNLFDKKGFSTNQTNPTPKESIMQNFEVQYTIRVYDPKLIAEIAAAYEKEAEAYGNRNEFLTEVIRDGLRAKSGKKEKTPTDEKDNLYALQVKVFDYIAEQFKAVYVRLRLLETLACSTYNIALALNNGETLFAQKIESGFYDDIPARCGKIIDGMTKELGLSDTGVDEE